MSAQLDEIRDRLTARFAPRWPAFLDVPEEWLSHLADLDTALAALCPSYQLHQVKEKFGVLRYYTAESRPACCVTWDGEHPAPVDDAAAEAVFESEFQAHQASAEHLSVSAAHEVVSAAMADLIATAERDSYTW